ncbi:MAG: hypothetical protein RL580_1051 [Pseudomonadota bacterium]|jgi:hypothetical protein
MAIRRVSTPIALLIGAALIGLGIYLNRGDRDPSTPSDPVAGEIDTVLGKRRPAAAGTQFAKLTVSPEKVELGVVPTCGARRTFEVALANDGEKPIRVDGWVSTCACMAPTVDPGFVIEPGDVFTLPLAVEPWDFGTQSHRIDFRVSGEGLSPNATAGRLRVNFTVDGPLRARPAVVARPERLRNFAVNIDRVDSDGLFLPESYEILGVEPRVAPILPPLEPGHGAINIDFQAIDDLAASPGGADLAYFEWTETADGRRWKSIELTVRTDLESCPEIRVRVRNRGR